MLGRAVGEVQRRTLALWVVAMFSLPLFHSDASAQLLGEWRLDESRWNGSAGEVIDASGNGHHGRVLSATTPGSGDSALTGDPGTCGYADQNRGAIQITGLPVSTNGGAKTTVTFWMKWDGTNSVMPIGWYRHDLWFINGVFGFNSFTSDIYGISSGGLANGWHHVAAEFTNGNLTANRLVIDGVEQTLSQLRSRPTNSRAYVQSEFRIGGVSGSSGYRFSGQIDEVRVYNGTLTTAEINDIKEETHPCGGDPVIPDPIAQWRFDEEAWNGVADEVLDSVGAHHGIAQIGASTTTGKICNAGSFDGASRVQIANAPALEVGKSGADFSVSYWLNLTSAPSRRRGVIAHKGSSNRERTFYEMVQRKNLRAGSGVSTTDKRLKMVKSTASLSTGSWIHVVHVKTGGRQKIYLNGVVDRTKNLKAPSIHNSGPLYIGSSPWQSGIVGQIDEFNVFDEALDDDQVATIYANQDAGLGLNGESRSCGPPEPVAEWRMDESTWLGGPDLVLDASGNGHHGSARSEPINSSAVPVVDADPGTCSYGDFDGRDDYVEVPWSAALNPDDFTLAIWARVEGGSRNWRSPITSRGYASQPTGNFGYNLYAGSNDRWQFWTGRGSAGSGWDVLTGPSVSNGTWTHVAATFEATGFSGGNTLLGTKRLYIDGVLVATRTNRPYQPMRYGVTRSTTIGAGGSGGDNYRFNGSLDEARIYAEALDQESIESVMDATHPCADEGVADHFVIGHDGEGVHCTEEAISVTAVDESGVAVDDYDDTITLNTQTGKGTWTLASGAGSFADATTNDGLATYTFADADDGVARFALRYVEGTAEVDVDVYDATARDDDAEGTLSFVPSALTVTASELPNPPPNSISDPLPAQVAGTPFAVHLAAYGTSPGDPTCGVIETYTGPKDLSFWSSHLDPSSGTLVPTIDDLPTATAEAGASDQTVVFSSGRAVVSAKYKDVGQITMAMKDTSSGGPASGIRGATNAFVSKPADFEITKIERPDGTSNPKVDTPTGELFVRAGESFHATIASIDADGDPTPNFGREASTETIRLSSASLVAPAGGRNGTTDLGTIDNATNVSAVSPPGTFAGTLFSFDEVGAIRLQASVADGDYLGAGDVTGTASEIVGRFAPSRFEVTSNIPSFETACGIGAFTWMGQPFGYLAGAETELTVTAVGASGMTTANYAGAWWRLTNGSLENRSYSVGGASVDVDETGLPAEASDPDITPNGDGTGTLVFSTGTGLSLSRSTPVAPFDAEIEFGIDVLDLDATAYASNPFTVGGTSSGTGIAFDVGKRFRFGRLRIDNAHGSEIVALPVALRAQYFDGTVFVDDTSDSCSSLTVADLDLTPAPAGLASTPVFANIPLLSGDSGLTMSAPNISGTVDVLVDLGPSGANLPWLQYDWPEDGNLDGVLDDNPWAKITFGIWQGRDNLIYTREVY